MLKLTAIRTVMVSLVACSAFTAWSQQITTPRTPSPAATVTQTIGISTVTVNYSRPAVKGREVWGMLVPYGWNKQGFGTGNSAPWRAGANENTVLTLSHDATIEGHKIPAGSYGLFFVVNKDNTGEVILSKDYRSWGSFFYDPAHDAMRANIKLRSIPETELLTYDFINANKTSSELVLNWEKKQLPVKIEFDVDNIVMANAEEELKSTTGFSWQGFNSAANYALQNKVNYEEALTWIDKAIAQNRNFNTLATKAGLLRAVNKITEADALMSGAVKNATEIELNNYAYQLMNQGQTDKAIEMFVLNTQQHPESPNAWDSLGEGYFTKGDKGKAITNFKKALSLNPPANVRANSEKFLKQLGSM